MASTLLTAYFTVAFATTVVIFVVSRRLGDDCRPAAQRTALSLAAGLVWPVMLLGVVELSSFAAYAKVRELDEVRERDSVLV